MSRESQIPIVLQTDRRRFAWTVGLFYATTLGMVGTYLPFFPVWLKAAGLDPSLIGFVIALPSLSRFTILPFVTAAAERHRMLRGAIVIAAFVTAAGFGTLGLWPAAAAIPLVFALTAASWTPIAPMTDGYTLKGAANYALDYGPLRVWGSAAFVAAALIGGVLMDLLAARNLIWIIFAVAALSALVSLSLKPLKTAPPSPDDSRASALLRQPLFVAMILASALTQASHAAYYGFASIVWQAAGLNGSTIAGLWSLGVVAEIAVFAWSPRFKGSPVWLVIAGAAGATLRWTITAQEPPLEVLAAVQLMHGMSFGMTHVGTVNLIARSVPHHVLAGAQGYLTACIGALTSLAFVLSGLLYARIGEGVYYAMAAIAACGAVLTVAVRRRLDAHHAIIAG